MKIKEIVWDENASCPVYILPNNKAYRPLWGEWAGYYEEVVNINGRWEPIKR